MDYLRQERHCLIFLLTLLLHSVTQVTAQVMPSMPAMPSPPASSTSSFLVSTDPYAGGPSSPTSSSSSFGSPMPTANDQIPPSQDFNNQQSNTGILNYYFLLLGVFIIIVALVWWALVRRNKRKTVLSRNNRESALARDLGDTPAGRRWGNGRFGFTRQPGPEEGLDERGQAPPPYMPAPPQAAFHPDTTQYGPGAGHVIPLQDLAGHGPKPPEYHERPVSGYGAAETGPSITHDDSRAWPK